MIHRPVRVLTATSALRLRLQTPPGVRPPTRESFDRVAMSEKSVAWYIVCDGTAISVPACRTISDPTEFEGMRAHLRAWDCQK